MSGYSRENKRQNEALESILRGELPEKRIFIANEDLEFKKQLKKEKEEEKKRIDEKFEATKEARVPWFCPECDKIMKKRLDDRMWYLYGHCFGCQVKVENKMRIKGTYDKWEEQKVIANKLAWITEQKQLIKEFKNQKNPEFWQQFRPDGYSVDKEKWKVDKSKIKKAADEALDYLQKIEDSLK